MNEKPVLSLEEENEYQKSSITKIIEKYHNKGEDLPSIVRESIDFTQGVYNEYYLTIDNQIYNRKIKETIAENLVKCLDFKIYEKYIDCKWLQTFNDDNHQFMSSLIYVKKFNVVNKFLDLAEKEDKKNNYDNEIFKPIFNLGHILFNFRNREISKTEIENFFIIFHKAIKVYISYYEHKCNIYKSKATDITKWHRNFNILNSNKIGDVNNELLKSDIYIDVIKDIFKQYDNQKENSLFTRENFQLAVSNGNEKIVVFYISEMLKSKLMNQKEIELLFEKSLHFKIDEMKEKIAAMFNQTNYSDYSKTYELKKIYEISCKYGNYQPKYNKLSEFILVDNNDFQNFFTSDLLTKEKILLRGLDVNQWKHMGILVEKFKEIHPNAIPESNKQKENLKSKIEDKFISENQYEVIYIINQINKLYSGKPEILSENKMNQVIKSFKEQIKSISLLDDKLVENFILNNKLKTTLISKKISSKMKI